MADNIFDIRPVRITLLKIAGNILEPPRTDSFTIVEVKFVAHNRKAS